MPGGRRSAVTATSAGFPAEPELHSAGLPGNRARQQIGRDQKSPHELVGNPEITDRG